MKILFWAGVLILALGVASLFVSIPQKETHKVSAGGITVGVQTEDSEKVPVAVSAVLIVAGAAVMIAGAMKKK